MRPFYGCAGLIDVVEISPIDFEDFVLSDGDRIAGAIVHPDSIPRIVFDIIEVAENVCQLVGRNDGRLAAGRTMLWRIPDRCETVLVKKSRGGCHRRQSP